MNPQEPQAVQIARLGFRQAIVVAAITAVAAIAGALIQTGRLHSRDEQIKKSDARVQDLQGQLAIASMSTEEKAARYRLTADHLESDLNLTAGKGSLEAGSSALPEAELNYRRLRPRRVLQSHDSSR